MAASALFLPSGAALSRRLSLHSSKLAHRVIDGRYKSVEIVLAFLVNIPWMFPGKQSTDDDSCTYMSMAAKIAMDLSLEKLVVFNHPGQQTPRDMLHRADSLDPRAALDIDGFPDMDPWSETGQLLLRNRERCWIALFVLERGYVSVTCNLATTNGLQHVACSWPAILCSYYPHAEGVR